MKFMKFVTGFEYFPRQGSGNIKSGNSFHKFHIPYALVQDPQIYENKTIQYQYLKIKGNLKQLTDQSVRMSCN
jgi:hypothetical protein